MPLLRSGRETSTSAPPASRSRRTPTPSQPPPLGILDIPQDVLIVEIFSQLDTKSLASVCCVNRQFKTDASDEGLWRTLFFARWASTPLLERAAVRAGGYKALYSLKHAADKPGNANPEVHRVATTHEVHAMIDVIVESTAAAVTVATPQVAEEPVQGLPLPGSGTREATPTAGSTRDLEEALLLAPNTPPNLPAAAPVAPPGSATVFLIDGSGSVSDAEFQRELAFAVDAAKEICDKSEHNRVALLQFSSTCVVEAGLKHRTAEEIERDFAVGRQNGGTHLNAAIKAAGNLLADPLLALAQKQIVIISDSRIDDFQATEAEAIAASVADSLNAHLFAVSAGRSTTGPLQKVLEARGCGANGRDPVISRFLTLMTKDSHW